jgi:hypothetical protein
VSKITVHAGDFAKGGAHSFAWGALNMYGPKGRLQEPLQRIELGQLAEVDVASEETFRKVGGSIGWGAAGLLVLGPAGMLAGVLVGGGKRKEVTFVAKLKDGRKMLATADQATYTKLSAAVFGKR